MRLAFAGTPEFARVALGLDAAGHRIGVVVLDLEPVEVVGHEELDVDLGRALRRRVLEPEVLPDCERRPVDFRSRQRGSDTFDLGHGHGRAPRGVR